MKDILKLPRASCEAKIWVKTGQTMGTYEQITSKRSGFHEFASKIWWFNGLIWGRVMKRYYIYRRHPETIVFLPQIHWISMNFYGFPAIFGPSEQCLGKNGGNTGPATGQHFSTQVMRNDGHGWYGMVWNGVLFAVLNIWSCQPKQPEPIPCHPSRLPRHRLASRQRRRWPKTQSYGRATCARFLGHGSSHPTLMHFIYIPI